LTSTMASPVIGARARSVDMERIGTGRLEDRKQ
jgi:hypothetical protein